MQCDLATGADAALIYRIKLEWSHNFENQSLYESYEFGKYIERRVRR
jgi:hypothetical protein